MLTIDSAVQYYAEKYLEIVVKETKCTNRGSVIIMDVNTGAVIAMATKGILTPNEPMTITNPDTLAKIALLSGDESPRRVEKGEGRSSGSTSRYRISHDPGSVFKTFTAAMALEEGTASENSKYYCKGGLKINDRYIKCHKAGGHGSLTFPLALSNSCNPRVYGNRAKARRQPVLQVFRGFWGLPRGQVSIC